LAQNLNTFCFIAQSSDISNTRANCNSRQNVIYVSRYHNTAFVNLSIKSLLHLAWVAKHSQCTETSLHGCWCSRDAVMFQIQLVQFWKLIKVFLPELHAVAVLGKNIWGGLAPHHLGGNHG